MGESCKKGIVHAQGKSSAGCCDKPHGGFDLMSFINKNTKYFFHALVLYLYPSCYGRFFFRNGDYPWNDAYTFFCMLVSMNFFFMAHWSHSLAGQSNDPGVIDWHHFRPVEDARLYREDKQKWERIKSGKQKLE